MFTTKEAGPHHAAEGPHQIDVDLLQVESRGSQHGNPRRSHKWRGGREGSVHTTHTVKVNLKGRVMCPMQRMTQTCNVKSTSWRESYIMLSEDVHRPFPNRPLKRQMVLVTDGGPELRPTRPFPMKKSTTVDEGTKAHLAKAQGTMP